MGNSNSTKGIPEVKRHLLHSAYKLHNVGMTEEYKDTRFLFFKNTAVKITRRKSAIDMRIWSIKQGVGSSFYQKNPDLTNRRL